MIRSVLISVALVVALDGAHGHTRFAADLDVRPYLLDPSLRAPPATPSPKPGMPASRPPAVKENTPKSVPAERPSAPIGPRNSKFESNRAAPRKVPAPASLTGRSVPLQLAPVPSEPVRGYSLGTIAFGALATTIILFVLPGLIRALDRLLEWPWRSEADTYDVPPGNDSCFDDFLKPTMSTAGYRSETDALRAMKEALDAELASVRAQIERERKHAKATEGAKEQP